MKVILLENIRKIGSIGEIIDVKRGFARNFLISKKKALYASKENIKEVEKLKAELNKKDIEKRNDAKVIEEKVRNKDFTIKKLATENKELLGHLLLISSKVAQQEGLQSWRTVINTGLEAGQTVFHLHLHVIGGRELKWPPG